MNSNVVDQVDSSCPFCKSAHLKHFTAYASDISPPLSKRVNIVECSQCFCAWQWPLQRTEQESVAVFNNAYLTQHEESYFDPEKRRSVAALQCEFIQSKIPTPARILDIGCGDGTFIKLMADHGWDATGLDPSLPFTATPENLDGKSRLIGGTLADVPQNELYDVVTLWDVVEHVEQPHKLISDAAAHVAPGGMLIVETGNYQSAGRISSGDEWWNYQMDHRWYLAPPQLEIMMQASGLESFHLAERVLRPWWKGRADMLRPRFFTLLKSIAKRPFHCVRTWQRYREMSLGHQAWRQWGGLEIMTMIGRRPKKSIHGHMAP
jgi:2-polyprenyl-3-methyl-5-hydroxy-6-metoxy-1,4-benzoquinol methylase